MANFPPVGQKCVYCGAEYLLETRSIKHTEDCPTVSRGHYQEPQEPRRTNVASIALARVDKGSHPRDHVATDALDLARAWIEEADAPPDHIIVFMGRTMSDNSSGTKYFQTGSFSAHAQVGLVYEGLDMLRKSNDD